MTEINFVCEFHGKQIANSLELDRYGGKLGLPCGCIMNISFGHGADVWRESPKKCSDCGKLIESEKPFLFEREYYHYNCFSEGYETGRIKVYHETYSAGSCMD